MYYLNLFFSSLYHLVLDMAPWLMLGFIIAGILHVVFPGGKINKILGTSSLKSVLMAALIGVPLPLCSCGVIPTGISIHKEGASKGAAVSFLISTPQTGIDSIMVTYSLLGLPFAIVRPVVAFITGIFGGIFTNKIEPAVTPVEKENRKSEEKEQSRVKRPVVEIFRYAFVDFLGDIAKWLVIGLLVAALIAVFVPDDFFASYIKNEFLGMIIILLVSVPMYVCATSSVPIAAVLLMKGLSPGAALVFLMAGPATNAATISVIGRSMGRKTLFSYLFTIIAGALLSGLFIDFFLPREWFVSYISHDHGSHVHGFLPYWLQLISGILMTAFILNVFLRKLIKKFKSRSDLNAKQKSMDEIKVFVRGMNCNHCKMSVENNLKKMEGIESINADLDTEVVTIKGRNVDLDQVKEIVEGIGYTYDGKV
jgi:uncharacterized protein